jgi:hypothetical protein
MRYPDEMSCLMSCFLAVYWTLRGLLDVAWFCVCKLGDSLAGEMNVRFVVLVGASASALGDRRVCVEVV